MDFSDALNSFADKLVITMNGITRDVVIEVGTSAIRISPVDTGHFSGNWQLTIGSETSSEIPGNGRSGALSSIISKASTLTAGQVAYILNHVEYGYDLEYGTYNGPTAKVTSEGFSRQAPEGMVRITEARFIPIVEEAVRLNI